MIGISESYRNRVVQKEYDKRHPTEIDEPDTSGWQTCPYCHQKIPVPIAQHTAKPGRCWAFDLVVSQWRIVLRGEK